jgi:hypothetical protein
MNTLLSSLALGVALVLTSACDVVEVAAQTETGTFDRTLSVSGPVVLDVRTGSGDIQITTGPGNSVHVIGRIRARDLVLGASAAERIRQIEKTPPIEQDGATIRIGETSNNPTYENVRISYEITVPADTQIQSRSGSGDQRIGSVRGPVSAQTGSGDIDIAESRSDVRAQTGSGDIHAGAVGGAIRAQTGSGDIEMTQTTKADADVKTGSGDVELVLAGNAAFDLVAHTGSGSIRVSQPMSARVQSRHSLEGTVGGGGASVRVNTGSGSITIR